MLLRDHGLFRQRCQDFEIKGIEILLIFFKSDRDNADNVFVNHRERQIFLTQNDFRGLGDPAFRITPKKNPLLFFGVFRIAEHGL